MVGVIATVGYGTLITPRSPMTEITSFPFTQLLASLGLAKLTEIWYSSSLN